MSRTVIDLTGQRFDRLLVLRQVPSSAFLVNKGARWECQCDCGVVKRILSKDLRSGNTTSCGCRRAERMQQNWANGAYGRRPQYE